MSVVVDPEIQRQYETNTAEYGAAAEEVATELKAAQEEVAKQVAVHREELHALGEALTEEREANRQSGLPVRRPEDNDISASAAAYQEADDDVPEPSPPPPPARPVRRPDPDEDEVPAFQWDED